MEENKELIKEFDGWFPKWAEEEQKKEDVLQLNPRMQERYMFFEVYKKGFAKGFGQRELKADLSSQLADALEKLLKATAHKMSDSDDYRIGETIEAYNEGQAVLSSYRKLTSDDKVEQ